jgi:hypothetical protein
MLARFDDTVHVTSAYRRAKNPGLVVDETGSLTEYEGELPASDAREEL